MSVNVTSAAVSVAAAAPGTIVAASPSGQYLLISDNVNSFIYLYDTTLSKVVLTQSLTASAGAFAPDSKLVTFLAPNNQLYTYSVFPTASAVVLPYVPNSIDVSSQGGMTYITSSGLGAIDVRATCNQSDWQTLSAAKPTLVAHLPNGNGAVVADSPSLDIVTTGAIPSGCPPTPQSTVTSYNLGFGSFTANQMFVSPDSSRAWVLSNLNSVIGLNLSTLAPFSISLANNAQPLSGGIMIDGSMVYLGGSDNLVHAINTSTNTDSAQINPLLKDPNEIFPGQVLRVPQA